MDSYSKKNLNISGVIAGLSVLFGLLGGLFTDSPIFLSVAFIVIGLDLIYFSHDLTMERVVKYKLNYKFYRGAYIFIGLAFIIFGLMKLIKG